MANRLLVIASLGVVYLLTFYFAQQTVPVQKQALIVGVLSPSASVGDKVTKLVTPKIMVTSQPVTSVISVSPAVTSTVQPAITLNNQAVFTPSPSLSPSSLITQAPAPDNGLPVVINEVAWMGTAASANDEWLELYNKSPQSTDLTGWTLAARDGTPSITLTGHIPAHGFYILERTSDDVVSDVVANQIYTGALGNGGEYLELKNPQGQISDVIDASSGWPSGDNPSGDPAARASMERVNPNLPGTSPSNWKSNNKATKNGHDSKGGAINGTPGQANSSEVF